MALPHKILDQMRREPANVRFSDLKKICEMVFGPPRQHGTSHAIFKTPWPGDPRVNIQNAKGKAKSYQVRQVLLAIDKLENARCTTTATRTVSPGRLKTANTSGNAQSFHRSVGSRPRQKPPCLESGKSLLKSLRIWPQWVKLRPRLSLNGATVASFGCVFRRLFIGHSRYKRRNKESV